MKRLDKSAVLDLVRSAIKTAGSQASYAKSIGFSAQYVNDVLQERRDLSESFLAALGLERVTTYQFKEKANA